MNDARAFTLVEMMLVVLILSVLAGAVVSNLGGVYADIALESAAMDIKGAARRGAEIARAERAPAELVFDMEEGTYHLKSGSKPERNAAPNVELDGVLPAGVSFLRLDVEHSASADTLMFFPDGRAEAATLILRGRRGLEKEVRFSAVPGMPPP